MSLGFRHRPGCHGRRRPSHSAGPGRCRRAARRWFGDRHDHAARPGVLTGAALCTRCRATASRVAGAVRIRHHRPVHLHGAAVAAHRHSPPVDAQRSGLGYTEIGRPLPVWRTTPGWCRARPPCGCLAPTTSNPAAIGYTGVEADFRALFGYSFVGSMPAFIDLEAAQRFRAGAPPTNSAPMPPSGCMPPRWLLLAAVFQRDLRGRRHLRSSATSITSSSSARFIRSPTGVAAAGGFRPLRAQRPAGERPGSAPGTGSDQGLPAQIACVQAHSSTACAGLPCTVKSVSAGRRPRIGEPAPHHTPRMVGRSSAASQSARTSPACGSGGPRAPRRFPMVLRPRRRTARRSRRRRRLSGPRRQEVEPVGARASSPGLAARVVVGAERRIERNADGVERVQKATASASSTLCAT